MHITVQTAWGSHVYALLSSIQYRRKVDELAEYTKDQSFQALRFLSAFYVHVFQN